MDFDGVNHIKSHSSTGVVKEIQKTAYRVTGTSQTLRQVAIGSRRKQNITWSTLQPNQSQRASNPTLPAVGNWHIAIKRLSVDTPDFRLLGKAKDVLAHHIWQCYSPQNPYRLQKPVVVLSHEVHQGLVRNQVAVKWKCLVSGGRYSMANISWIRESIPSDVAC